MSRIVRKALGQRRTIGAGIVVLAGVILLLALWLAPTRTAAQGGGGDPSSGIEATNDCQETITTTGPSCAVSATVTFTNITMSPAAEAGAPYDSIACVGDPITATLQYSIANSIEVTAMSGLCPSPWTTYSTNGRAPMAISNLIQWADGSLGPTNRNSVTFTSAVPVSGSVTFSGQSAPMPPLSPCQQGSFINSPLSKSYAVVGVSSISRYPEGIPVGNDTYLYCPVPTNAALRYLLVTATPNPWVSDQFLPFGWNVSGGIPYTNGDGTISRTTVQVDMAVPGSNVLVATSGCIAMTNFIVIERPALGVPKWVLANGDDDNHDLVVDREQPLQGAGSTVSGENDLLPISLGVSNPGKSDEQVTLNVSWYAYAGWIRVWDSPQRGPNGPLLDNSDPYRCSISWPLDQMPATLYVEGVGGSYYVGDVGDVWLTLQTEYSCGTSSDLTVLVGDLDVDSNNQNGLEGNSAEELIEDIAGVVSTPGKILMVNSGDSDGDGIPDYADGFDVNGQATNNASAPFTPMTFSVAPQFDPAVAMIRFTYASQPPSTNQAGPLRIWKKDGTASRLKAEVDAGGDYVAPNTGYSLTSVFNGGNGGTLYVEALEVSTSIGDRRVSVEIDPDGSGPEGFRETDAVRFTALETALDRVDESNSTWQTAELEESHPSPVINLSACSISGVYSSGPDYQRLYGQLNLTGTVKSSICDIYPEDNNDIDEVKVFVNDLDTPVATVSLTRSKSVNPSSLSRPFDYTGGFGQQLNIQLETGPNLIRVEAVDKVFGIKGYSEYLVDVTGQPPVVLPVVVAAAQMNPLEVTATEALEEGMPSLEMAATEAEEEEEEWMSYDGWTFPGDNGTGLYNGTLAKESNGGVFKPYLFELKGPQAMLESLQSVTFEGVERRLKRYQNRVFLGLKQQSQIQDEIATVMLGVAGDYTVARSSDNLSISYPQGFAFGFCEGGVYLVGDIGSLAVKIHPFTVAWRFAHGDYFTEERQFTIKSYKAAEQLAAFWGEWNGRTAAEIMMQDPEADSIEVALGLISEDQRVLGEAVKHIIVAVGEATAGMDSFDRGRLEGRIGFEVASLLIAEVKLGQAAKVTKVKEIGIVEKIATKVDEAVDAGKLAKGDATLGQKLKDAMAAARLRIRQFSRTGRYADLEPLADSGYARNHLNQAAAFESDLAGQSFIPRNDGVCHYLMGPYVNQQKWAGSPHWKFHFKMEEFWRPYRKNGSLYGQRPTCGQYSEALRDALTHSGVPQEEVGHLLTLARNDRMMPRTRPDGSQFRLLDSDLVPRIPNPTPIAPPPE